MTLHEALHEARARMRRGAAVTIARAGEHAYQVRLTPSKEDDVVTKRDYRVDERYWTVDSAMVLGWSHWSRFFGFDVEAAMADDWRIVVVEEP